MSSPVRAPSLVPKTAQRYSRTAAMLHWVIAAAIICNLAIGYACAAAEFPGEEVLVNLHKLIGLAVMALSVVRLGWRLIHSPPAFAYTSALLRRAAATVHALLYVAMFAIPFTGWLVTSSFPKRHPISLGLFDIPFLPVRQSLPRTILFHDMHAALALAAALLIVGHLGAALYHQFVLRDGMLGRMKLASDC